MVYLRPDLVRADLIHDHPPAEFPPYDVYPVDTRPIPPEGVLSSAAGASAQKGRVAVAQIVSGIAASLPAEFGG